MEEYKNAASLFNLKGKVAIVTGGNQGIGLAIAEALANFGANIVIANRRLQEGKKAAWRIEKYGVRAIAIPTDVSVKKDVDRLTAQTLTEFGKIDILVNNAGVLVRKSVIDTMEEDWDKIMNINLKGVFLCSQAVGKHMVKQKKGKIINVSSNLCFKALHERSVYSASKAGVSQLTKVMALEWAKYHINVNAIAPGPTDTLMSREYFQRNPDALEWFLKRIPMGRLAKTDDLKGIAVFLASKASDYITGQTIFVDGGYTIW